MAASLPTSASIAKRRISAKVFDTFVILYLASADAAKAARAEAALMEGGVISVQVLNEAANVCVRKMRMGWKETNRFLSALRKILAVQPLTLAVHETGLRLAARYGISVYDAMILAAALENRCDTVFSEDMQHGQTIEETLRIVNPFYRTG